MNSEHDNQSLMLTFIVTKFAKKREMAKLSQTDGFTRQPW